MKRGWKLGLLLTLLLLFGMQMTVMAAGETVAINSCYIEGDQVKVMASGKVAASDDGNYYLFALKTYEAGVGARQDYCAAAPAAQAVAFSTPLQLNTAGSKLYSRFVVTARRGGQFVPVSSEMYILNPEAVATHSTASISEATGNIKGLNVDWRDLNYHSDMGLGHVTINIETIDAFKGSDVKYTYNGKEFGFSGQWVTATDYLVRTYNKQLNADIVAIILNKNTAATTDMIYPEALASGKRPHHYAVNVESQAGEEKLAALMSFISERYSGGDNGSIHNYVVGNEVNSSDTWHYAGEISAEEFSRRYAKEFRVCYNAVKSHNLGANVYICTDQRWLHNDGGSSYGGKPVIDGFAAEITKTGNINWGLSFHPYPVPLTYTRFWTSPPGAYAKLKLVDHTEKTKMIIPTNMDVVVSYMSKPQFLAPTGAVRNLFISELGINSTNGQDEGGQAAGIVYAYKLAKKYPCIKGLTYSRLTDDAAEIPQGLWTGLLRVDGSQKPSYAAFKNMNVLGMEEYLPYIGASSWAQLGVQ